MSEFNEIRQKIETIESELQDLENRRKQLNNELSELNSLLAQKNFSIQPRFPIENALVDNASHPQEKIIIFRNLFKGREDVFPCRFENSRTGKSGYAPVCQNEWITGICQKPNISCQKCRNRKYSPLSDEVIHSHLLGIDKKAGTAQDFTIGVYPLLKNDTCWFLAVDFDKSTWIEDTKAFLKTCSRYNVPAVLERSRSGNGGHIWVFFLKPVSAVSARKLGSLLLTDTMNHRPEIGMDSYDRLFPSQDTLPKGGFGNLIALPLQKGPREKQNSVFVDANLNPYPDQWSFLSSIEKMPQSSLEEILKRFDDENEIMGVRPVEINENEPWELMPSRNPVEEALYTPLPPHMDLVLSDQIYIEKENLSPALRNRIIRLAAFQNPEFYRAQAMRFSTFGKPRVICCCEEFSKHLALPRGCLEELMQLLENFKIKFSLVDKRYSGKPITFNFQGALHFEQELAVNQLKKYETGVLSASTSFGKTVIGIWLIAQRKINTLIIVHRKQLMDQWKESLLKFLDVDKKDIGQFGGGKKKLTGKIDIAMIQSLGQKGVVNDLVADYGQVIVDECHHISAVSFEQVTRHIKARYILGLSATVTRKDGHHPIIFMQCGPVRYRVNDRQQAVLRVMAHKIVVRCTAFKLPDIGLGNQPISIQEIYALLAIDIKRNEMIIQDVLDSIQAGRSPVFVN